MDLTEAQWRRIEPLLPKPPRRPDGRGRPWRDPRDVLNGILWILRTGAQWDELPDRYPPKSTCHRRFQAWARSGTLYRVLQHLARELAAAGGYDFSEAFIDATFAGAKKGAPPSASPARGKAPRSWQSQTVRVFLSPLLSQVRPRVRLASLTTS
jgi:transposase